MTERNEKVIEALHLLFDNLPEEEIKSVVEDLFSEVVELMIRLHFDPKIMAAFILLYEGE